MAMPKQTGIHQHRKTLLSIFFTDYLVMFNHTMANK